MTGRRKRAILSESTSNRQTDKKKMPKKKGEKKQKPELAFDLEAEPRPTLIKISSGTTEIGSEQTDQIGQKERTVQERRKEGMSSSSKLSKTWKKRQGLGRAQRRDQPESSRENDARPNDEIRGERRRKSG